VTTGREQRLLRRPAVSERADHERFFRDHLRYAFAADTSSVIGSRPAFALAGAEDGPAQLEAGIHRCAEIGLGPGEPVPPPEPGRWVTQDWTTPWIPLG
jgi:hypothetical protein